MTVNIHGREYVTVPERTQAFLTEHGEHALIGTELLHDDGNSCVFKASVHIDGRLVATGHAREERGASSINKTSYVENCETSAVGRALAFAGYGIDGSIASADEVQAAMAQQPDVLGIMEVAELVGQLALVTGKDPKEQRESVSAWLEATGDLSSTHMRTVLKQFRKRLDEENAKLQGKRG